MPHDPERIERLQDAMKEAGLDAIACGLPSNVLLLTGYFPVVGRSFAIATREGEVVLFAPRDEADLSEDTNAARTVLYDTRPGELRRDDVRVGGRRELAHVGEFRRQRREGGRRRQALRRLADDLLVGLARAREIALRGLPGGDRHGEAVLGK